MSSGKELTEQLRVGYPESRSLFMSGYTASVIAHHGMLDAGVTFLQETFNIHALA